MSSSVIIVDDEPPARAKLVRFLAELDEFRVVAEAGDVNGAVLAIKTHRPDVVYLDIQLGRRSGFEILDGLHGELSPHIVFTTAFSEHAVRAFDIQAIDYLLEPFDRERFLKSIARVRQALQEPEHGDLEERIRRVLAALPGHPASATQLVVKDRTRAYLIAVDSIDRISAAGNYVEIHAAGKVHLIREPLTQLLAQLNPDEFIRVHRSHVVKLSCIAEMTPLFHGDYELLLKNGEKLALSRRYKALLPAAIRDRL